MPKQRVVESSNIDIVLMPGQVAIRLRAGAADPIYVLSLEQAKEFLSQLTNILKLGETWKPEELPGSEKVM